MSVPPYIERQRAPGGLVALLFVDGELVDGSPLVDQVDDVAGVAIRHAATVLSSADAGKAASVGIYDGDSGELVVELNAPRVIP